ncbi:MAG: hypothetical protein JW860_10940 [Sedimentisphaerales bacterium]|nr:hypothetical protein [Sedimentisphaerales bacterium]
MQTVQRMDYDEIGQKLLEANAKGGITRYDYDELGHPYQMRTYCDPCALTIDDNSFIPSRYDGFTPLATTRYGYDLYGRRTYEKNPSGGRTDTTYTRSGLVKTARGKPRDSHEWHEDKA